jgi:hypothetical protein
MIRAQTDVFSRKPMLRHHIILHINEAVAEALENAAASFSDSKRLYDGRDIAVALRGLKPPPTISKRR